jgi:hypothetical protein
LFDYGAMHMGKVINEPIVYGRPGSEFARQDSSQGPPPDPPLDFTWRGRAYRVESLGGEWRTLGRWWEGEGERRYVRALTSRGQTLDLCLDARTGQWSVHEVQD